MKMRVVEGRGRAEVQKRSRWEGQDGGQEGGMCGGQGNYEVLRWCDGAVVGW